MLGRPALGLAKLGTRAQRQHRTIEAQTELNAAAEGPAITHNSWSSGAPMPVALKFPAGTGVIKGKIYVVGGNTANAVIADNQIYDPATSSWSVGAALPSPTFASASAVVHNILYVMGGLTAGIQYTNAVWAYDPKTNTWSAKSAMPTARASTGATVEKNVIYVIGGNGTDGTRLTTVESYNPATNSWTEESPLLLGKSEPSVGLVGTTILASGGYSSSGETGDTEAYNVSTNSWKSLTADPSPRNAACAAGIGPQLYVASGDNGSIAINVTESFKVFGMAASTCSSSG